MTGSVRKATLLAACGLFAASVAVAGVPNAGMSIVPTVIELGGTNNSAVVDPAVQATIVVNDAGGNPVQNSTVEIRLGTCASNDFRLCGVQPHSGVGVSCVDKTVFALTDASGNAVFRIVGHAVNPGGGSAGAPAAGLNVGCAEIRADGVTLATGVPVAAYDQNGLGGVNPVDLSLFLNDRFSAAPCLPACNRIRSDYNGDGTLNPVDLSLFLAVRFASNSLNSCATLDVCP